MEVHEGRSSSNDLSSAPSSDGEAITVITRPNPFTTKPSGGQVFKAEQAQTLASASAASSATVANRQDSTQPKPQRKPRKKKEVDPNAPPVEKKPRKSRASAGTTTAASRKKLKTENAEIIVAAQPSASVTDLGASRLVQPTPFLNTSVPVARPYDEAAKYNNPVIKSQPQSPPAPRYNEAAAPQPSMPRSTPMFDPVRGAALERSQSYASPAMPKPLPTLTPPRTIYNPSTSPAISSIINPPDLPREVAQAASQPPQHTERFSEPDPISSRSMNLDGSSSTPMELDPPLVKDDIVRKGSVAEKGGAEAEAKPKRAKEQPPPIPTGSGLLSSSLFGGDSLVDNGQAGNGKGTSIALHVDLKDPNNKVINFARLAEEKYGFAALYPRQAAQKERLARVAAAGAALERSASSSKGGGTSGGESGDEDLSVDIDRDSDNDGDVAMTGLNGAPENSGTDGPAQKKTRKRKDEYDADDPFVDDSEMLWEAQAAASKDGFFVYCGPLVPEGEKPTVERADGTVKRGRGRGRGGGPGSRGGKAGAVSTAASEGSAKASGPVTRGGGVIRKPRVTKAEKAQRDLEKKQREQVATIAAKPAPIPT